MPPSHTSPYHTFTFPHRNKFAFKYGRSAQDVRLFDRKADLLKWLLHPAAHPPADPAVAAAAPPVAEEDAAEWRASVLDWLHESEAPPFKEAIRAAMQTKLPPPPTPPASQPEPAVEEEDDKEEEEAGAVPAPPSKRKAVGRPPKAPPAPKPQQKQQQPTTTAAAAAAAAATAIPDPSKLKARPLLRPRVGAKRKRAVAVAAAAAAEAEGNEGGFVQTVRGSERFFGQKLHSAKGGGLAAPASLVKQARGLDLPSVQEIRSIVASLVPTHSDERRQLEARYEKEFPAWVDDIKVRRAVLAC